MFDILHIPVTLFWILMGGIFIYETVIIYFEKYVGAFIGLILTMVAFWTFTSVPFSYIHHNPVASLRWFGLYLLIGVFYAVFKWVRYMYLRKKFFRDFRSKWLKESHLSQAQVIAQLSEDEQCKFFGEFMDDWNEAIGNGKFGGYDHLKYSRVIANRSKFSEMSQEIYNSILPNINEEKSRMTNWICYWPISLLNYIIADFLIDLGKFIAEWLEIQFRSITIWYYADIKKDIGAK